MKIAFYNIFGENKNPEFETMLRLEHVFSEQGHCFVVLDRNGYVTNECADKGRYVEGINVDCMFTYNSLELGMIALPDTYSTFLHWAPIGFLVPHQAELLRKSFNLYDSFAGTYEREVMERALQKKLEGYPLLGSSVPKDYVCKPIPLKQRKLFYVGINVERMHAQMRYGTLLEELDRTGLLEIYGPTEVYGLKNVWAGFQSYRGEIPFDGHTIIEKINRAGVCLALNSPMHNDVNGISNRTYEGAAAGAVIISDDNEFVHKYFGDSVFYIDRDLSEEEASKRILEILEWTNNNPEKAYEMACRSQQVFLDKLSLDKMVSDFVESTQQAMKRIRDINYQIDIIDVICFIDEVGDYPKILNQLRKQYYQNLHLILVADKETYQKLNVDFQHDFVQRDRDFRGRSFVQAKKCLKGQYFMFIDRYSVLHARHIYKNHEVLSGRDELFVYSGCYMRRKEPGGKKYIVLNNKPIMRDEFLLFSQATDEYGVYWEWRDRQCFHIENIFSRSASLFKKEILDFSDDDELSVISDAVHFYLAVCSLLKADKAGRFTNALTTGYSANDVEEVNRTVFGYSRRHWNSNKRSAKTYVKELNDVFFRYTFECHPVNVLPRRFEGEITWYNEYPSAPPPPEQISRPPEQISRKRKFVRVLKKLLPRRIKDLIIKCIHA